MVLLEQDQVTQMDSIQGGLQEVGLKHKQNNGTSWTEVADLNTARYALSGFGTRSSTQMVWFYIILWM